MNYINIYELVDPRYLDVPRYVGKTNRLLSRRLGGHVAMHRIQRINIIILIGLVRY